MSTIETIEQYVERYAKTPHAVAAWGVFLYCNKNSNFAKKGVILRRIVKNKKSKTKMSDLSKFFVIRERIVVSPDPAEEKTAGGIIIPDTAKERPKKGIVVISSEAARQEGITVGCRVQYGKYAGTDIEIIEKNGKKQTFEIVHLNEVLLVEKGEGDTNE